jgi:hypothetical protein
VSSDDVDPQPHTSTINVQASVRGRADGLGLRDRRLRGTRRIAQGFGGSTQWSVGGLPA